MIVSNKVYSISILLLSVLLLHNLALAQSRNSSLEITADSGAYDLMAAPKSVKLVYDANVVCQNDSANLFVDYSAYGIVNDPWFSWNGTAVTQTNSLVFTPSNDTSSVLVELYDGSTKIGSDSVKIYRTSYPLPYSVVHDTICLGQTATLGITAGQYWNWSQNNGTTQYINDRPLRNTTYTVEFSNYPIKEIGFINHCFLTDSAIATVLSEPTFTLSGDSTICHGFTATITLTNGTLIKWSNGSNQATVILENLDSDSILSVIATDPFGCRGNKQWKVSVVQAPDGEIISNPDTVCLGQEVELSVMTDANAKIRWPSGNTERTIIIKPRQDIAIYCDISLGSSGKCSTRVYKVVSVKNCSPVFFPSGFKPDGYTKEYKVIGEMDSLRTYYFAIFTRNGKKVFETKDLTIGWDGRYKGEWVNPDVYVFYYQETYDGVSTKRNGTITVVK